MSRKLYINALDKNPTVVARLQAAGPTGQYKAVGSTLAASVAKRTGETVHQASWSLVNAYNNYVVADAEEVNEDYSDE